jgi:carbonic anhydrase
MDSRTDPYKIFELQPRDAIVLRSPGGRTCSMLHQIAAVDSRFLIDQIVVFQHNDCGTSHLTEELIDKRIQTVKEPDHPETKKIRDVLISHTIHHGAKSLQGDLALLREQPFLRKEIADTAVGFWMDTFTGEVKVVR